MQNNKPLAFYTRKLNSAQSQYTVGEKELLGIVETLKAFENILLGQRVVVHTDHLNLLYRKHSSQRIQRWRVLLEKYRPEVWHIEGKKNVIADTISRHPMIHKEGDLERDAEEEKEPLSYQSLVREIKESEFPLQPKLIAQKQLKDTGLKQLKKKNLSVYKNCTVEGVDLVCRDNKIYIPFALQNRVLAWYYKYLVHPGETRMEI